MNIAIIGAGNMGGATALGFARFIQDLELTVTAAHAATLEKFAVRGIGTTLDNVAATAAADIVILGVKPWLVSSVLEQIKPALTGKILVSMAAGIPSAQMEEWLEGSGVTAAYTAIPNLAIEIGESMTFITEILGDPAAELQVLPLFNKVGRTLVVDERQMQAGMMVASCGTAFALRYARAAMEGGIELGLYPREALEAVLQTMKGAADLAIAHGTHPEQEIDKVTTPGGITIRGLNAMEAAGFSAAVVAGLKSYEII
ncbi:MAG: NAD(P)-binding domain-containing protein [Bacteroidales bacterium]|nr:NAD(P)-binding domain-containing protein [Bacteroidales bacterium]